MARDPKAKTITLPVIVIDDARKKLVLRASPRSGQSKPTSADDWECALLFIFYKYLEVIGVDEDLRRLPMKKMWVREAT